MPITLADIQRQMDEATEAHRQILERAIFSSDPLLALFPKPSKWQRRMSRVRGYVSNLWAGCCALGRAMIGQDAIPESDDY
ncbi:MAG TPA: hypothetical protein VNN79_14695 [Actinomycetota bacterium]|nr:hypothetical protein [Actinomycetota bacterium]